MSERMETVSMGRGLGGEEAVGVLAALGKEREVDMVWMGDIGVDQLDQLLGPADGLPTIRELQLTMTRTMRERGSMPVHPHCCLCVCSPSVPDDVKDAGSVTCTHLSSLIGHTLHLRGLQRVGLLVDDTTAEQRSSINASPSLTAPRSRASASHALALGTHVCYLMQRATADGEETALIHTEKTPMIREVCVCVCVVSVRPPTVCGGSFIYSRRAVGPFSALTRSCAA